MSLAALVTVYDFASQKRTVITTHHKHHLFKNWTIQLFACTMFHVNVWQYTVFFTLIIISNIDC